MLRSTQPHPNRLTNETCARVSALFVLVCLYGSPSTLPVARAGQADGRVVSNFIMQALSGEDITIYGDGSQTRSFCFVDDLIEGLMRLMNNDTEVCGGSGRRFTCSHARTQLDAPCCF